MKENYEYPLMDDWSNEEIVKMVEFYAMIEEVNTKGIEREKILEGKKQFEKIAGSIATQKQIDRRFQQVSNYSIYRTLKAAQNSNKKIFKMEDQ